jgi:hypothetical protein
MKAEKIISTFTPKIQEFHEVNEKKTIKIEAKSKSFAALKMPAIGKVLPRSIGNPLVGKVRKTLDSSADYYQVLPA